MKTDGLYPNDHELRINPNLNELNRDTLTNSSSIPGTESHPIDFLIVGQGIAGTLLAYFLELKGQTVRVVDDGYERSASRVAAGIVNPITGRRFIKSWRIDELIPFARQTYRALEDLLGISIYHEQPLIRSIFTIAEENDWISRTADPSYDAYLEEYAELGSYAGRLIPARSYGAVRQAAQVDLPLLLAAYRDRLQTKGALIDEGFDHQRMTLTAAGAAYEGLHFQRVVFCEGYRALENPFFNYLPFKGDKGEVLIVRIPGLRFDRIIKHRVFIVPLPDDRYWVGATYVHRYQDDRPTPEGRQTLEEKLRSTLQVPFEIVEHRAAVRPTVKDRRPFLGNHLKYPQLSIFNGLGTKGSSLGPLWAHHLAAFLVDGAALDPEVSIRRFE